MLEDLKKGDRVLIKCSNIWFVDIIEKRTKENLIFKNRDGSFPEYQFDLIKGIREEQMVEITNKLLEMRERFEAEVLPLDPIKSFEK